jgi:hypothetical protein
MRGASMRCSLQLTLRRESASKLDALSGIGLIALQLHSMHQPDSIGILKPLKGIRSDAVLVLI